MFDLMLIHPILLFIFSDINLYCHERQIPVVITRVVDEKIDGISVSNTHEEGRAIDISIRGWSKTEIEEVVDYFNEKYSELYGAFSYSDNLPRLMIYHKGTGYHIHIQIRRL